jgi:hypothetical protein
MAISAYRAGYQPLKAPATQIRSYGVAGKWSAEAVRSRGVGRGAGNADASEFFLGPKQTGTDWAAAFATASGSSQDAVMQDYVKRNADKFSGSTLEAMLTATGLVDWYKAKKAEEIAKAQEELQKTLDSADAAGLTSDRTKEILSGLDPAKPAAQPAAAAPAGSTVNVTV